MSKNMATVVGGQGFIGRALANYLLTQGWNVFTPSKGENLTGKSLGYVFYCAGLTADYLKQPNKTVDAHISTLLSILQFSDYVGLVYLSSTRLYDRINSQDSISEDTVFPINPFEPRHFYDLTKLAGENLCYVLGKGKAKVARLACVYDRADMNSGFLPQLLWSVKHSNDNNSLSVASSPYFERDYVHLSDVLRSLVAIVTIGKYAVYNIASGSNTSNTQLAEKIKQQTDITIVFESNLKPKMTPVINVDRMINDLGVQPISVFQGIELALRDDYEYC